MDECCKTCLFYKDKESDWKGVRSGYGVCRRYPEYIDTNSGRWCGEYQKKKGGTT